MTTGVGGLLARIGGGLFQQAYVVDDLAAAEASMTATLGCGPWVDLPATDLEYVVRGEPTTAALGIGFARSGDLQIELIHPARGGGLHVEFLHERGPGLHHLGFMVDDRDATIELGTQLGFPCVMSGEFGRLRFGYLDTADALGVYAEIVEDPDGMLMSLMPWR
jgi:catechol 2,3-dioxygenase-like lactoylglutathione lyase family enzyme